LGRLVTAPLAIPCGARHREGDLSNLKILYIAISGGQQGKSRETAGQVGILAPILVASNLLVVRCPRISAFGLVSCSSVARVANAKRRRWPGPIVTDI